MLEKSGVNLQVQKEQGGNERIIEEMKRKLPPLIEKYNNKKH